MITTNLALSEIVDGNKNSEVYKIIKFKAGEKDANRILYEYIKITEDNEISKIYERMKSVEKNNDILLLYDFSESSLVAYKIDLNDDGVMEIIGYANFNPYRGWDGVRMYILKKDYNKYKNISDVDFEPIRNITVLKNKINGYRELKFGFSHDEQQGYAFYKNNSYKYNYPKMGNNK